MGADKSRYWKYLEDLENDFLKGRNDYPETLNDAYRVLSNCKTHNSSNHTAGKEGVAFLLDGLELSEEQVSLLATEGGNDDDDAAARRKRNLKYMKCYNCGKRGHLSKDCRSPRRNQGADKEKEDVDAATNTDAKNDSDASPRLTGTTSLMAAMTRGEYDGRGQGWQFVMHVMLRMDNRNTGVTLAQDSPIIPSTWILLDNQSTVCAFTNGDLLKNIREVDSWMDIHCNAGVTSTNMVGDLKGFGEVWYNPKGIANILSMAVVEKSFRVTYDSGNDMGFTVEKKDGSCRTFRRSRRGLFYLDTAEKKDEKGTGKNVAFVNTVEQNKLNYTKRDYSRAEAARKLQNVIGRPGLRHFVDIVDGDHPAIDNCPIIREDIDAAEDIFGTNLGSLKGKQTRRKTKHVRSQIT